MKLPRSLYNWTSLAGSVLAVISLFMIGFLFIISMFFSRGSSYLGLFIYIVLPVFLVIGLLLIPVGMWLRYRKDKKKKQVMESKWPVFDLNNNRTRNALTIFGVGTVIFLLLSAVGSYEAFHYTESVEFCGTVCHEVMKPEYTAYQNSSHARVACVDCHVGSGASWYVRSKLSGLYQVYAVTLGSYPKPIPTPIRNLRPARETCEECHWPQKFYSRRLVVERHYLPDEASTEWDISLQMKTGPVFSAHGMKEGIHWHINPDVKIEYAVTSKDRELLPWIRYTNTRTGEVHVYEDSNNKLTQDRLDSLEVRVMDCMDCHNRPSHDYRSPLRFINDAITAGIVPHELPDIKYLAMDILGKDYPSTDSALYHIENDIDSYYQTMYEELFGSNRELIKTAVAGIQSEYLKNIFPEMKVRYDAYHNNIGHLEFMGCFRCHDDRHMTPEGRVITKDCNLCHTIISQGIPDSLQAGSLFSPLEFNHPNDPNQAWKEKLCIECHKDLYRQ
jgi:hypothetical protein